MTEIINFPGATRLDIPAERILRQALDSDLETAIVIGRTRDGNIYFVSSFADGGDVLWLMEIAKKHLLGG